MEVNEDIIKIIIVNIIGVVCIIYLFWKIKKKGLKTVAIEFIIKAEELYEKGDNESKLNYVIDKVIESIPLPFNIVITRENIKSLVQNIFDSIKSELDYMPKEEHSNE